MANLNSRVRNHYEDKRRQLQAAAEKLANGRARKLAKAKLAKLEDNAILAVLRLRAVDVQAKR